MQNSGDNTWQPAGKSITVLRKGVFVPLELAPAYRAASSVLRTSGCLMKNGVMSSITSSHKYRSTDSATIEKSSPVPFKGIVKPLLAAPFIAAAAAAAITAASFALEALLPSSLPLFPPFLFKLCRLVKFWPFDEDAVVWALEAVAAADGVNVAPSDRLSGWFLTSPLSVALNGDRNGESRRGLNPPRPSSFVLPELGKGPPPSGTPSSLGIPPADAPVAPAALVPAPVRLATVDIRVLRFMEAMVFGRTLFCPWPGIAVALSRPPFIPAAAAAAAAAAIRCAWGRAVAVTTSCFLIFPGFPTAFLLAVGIAMDVPVFPKLNFGCPLEAEMSKVFVTMELESEELRFLGGRPFFL
mmetsp:Transcript_18657/g.25995  ORF Transcript_18657/g.25995 Transcript_18657/m.25995 type:complete len:355 (+) Transcript_18657:1089-2153(+)